MSDSVSAPARSQLVSAAGLQQLFVDDDRFVILGGELHNSSSSSVSAIRDSFARLDGMNLNTVLAPVAWGQFEPREGEYDYTLVDELIASSRRNGLKLIPLWFGAWKNGRSTYVPAWVRADSERFPRAEIFSRKNRDCLSPFAPAAADADARAFAALMAHIRDTDADHGTVVMVQVENEVGILGDSRDRSALADDAFRRNVPNDVLEAVAADSGARVRDAWIAQGRPQEGSWSSVFGHSADTDEAFMAAAYARHLERVAAAGKKEYALPLFANAWLYTQLEVADGVPAGGQEPGIYPSGGPLPHVGAIWTALAPSLDLLVPDIYFGDFPEICREYQRLSGGLFIPEMRRDIAGVADAFIALGSFSAIGVSPFGIDTTESPEGDALIDAYGSLSLLRRATSTPPLAGFRLNDATPDEQVSLGRFSASIHREPNRAGGVHDWGYGLIVRESDDTFIICGRGVHISFTSDDGPAALVKVEELKVSGSGVEVYRELNGDETESGTLVILPSLEPRPVTSDYHIPTVRHRSGIVRVTLAL